MRKTLKRLLVTVMILAMCLSGISTAYAVQPANQDISVQYNGENIAFTDAVPKIINGRTMVPFRQILETMGAQVTYAEKTRTVNAKKEDIEFSFVIGSGDITIIKDGKTTSKKMDVVPFIDAKTNRTYVPARFMAESMNYSVSWDQNNKTAIIIDPMAILANVDKDFSIIAKLFTSNIDYSKNYETTGSFSLDMAAELVPETDKMEFAISGDMSGVQHKTNAEIIMNMTMNFDKMISAMTDEEKELMKPMLDMFKNVDMKMKMNGETGETYINSPMFSIMDPAIDSNTWLKMNIFDTYDEMGIDLRPMMDLSQKPEQAFSLLAQLALLSANTGDVNTYNDMKTAYAFMKNMIGDEAFKTTTSGANTTYSLKLDKNSITAAITKTALEEKLNVDLADVNEMINVLKETDLSADIVIRDKNDQLDSYSINYKLAYDQMKMNLDMSGSLMSSTIEMHIDAPSMGQMTVKAASKYVETSKTPNLSLPEGAKIIDYNDYLMPTL